MSIHSEHPFLPPESERSPVRRLRGRLPAPVTLWTSSYRDDRAGLTVSSMLVADGEPGLVVALIDADSDLYAAATRSGRVAVTLLGRRDAQLADAFAGLTPAPGGAFRLASWRDTEWGPVLEHAGAWAGCHLLDEPAVPTGWAVLLRARIEHVEIAEMDDDPLVHHRGRYRHLE